MINFSGSIKDNMGRNKCGSSSVAIVRWWKRFLATNLLFVLLLGIIQVDAVNIVGDQRYAEDPLGGIVDMAPLDGNLQEVGITVSNTQITGNLWSEEFGWVDMQPDGGGVTVTVQDEGSGYIGRLSGSAWGEDAGWITFGQWDGEPDSGVYIDADGYFQGVAFSEQVGEFSFGDYMLLNGVSNVYTDEIGDKESYWAKTTWGGLPPEGGSIDYTDGFHATGSITIAVDRGTDVRSGMSTDPADYILSFRETSLEDGECVSVSWSAWGDAGVVESPEATSYDFNVTNATCYQFRYTVADALGNSRYYSAPYSVVLVQLPEDVTHQAFSATPTDPASRTLGDFTTTGFDAAEYVGVTTDDTSYAEGVTSGTLENDGDSQYIDTISNLVSRESYAATRISDSVVSVMGRDWSDGDKVEVDSKVDAVTVENTMVEGWRDYLNIAEDPSNWQNNPEFAIDSNGTIHVVFNGKSNLNSSYHQQLYTKSTDGGVTWTDKIIVGGNVGSHHGYEPDIAVDSNDDLYVVWQSPDDGQINSQIKFSKSVDGGDTWSAWGNLGTTGYYSLDASIAIDSNDVLHVVYAGNDAANTSLYHVKYIRSTDGGSSWSAFTNLSLNTSNHQYKPHIAISANNDVHVVW